MLQICADCTCRYSVGAPCCPQCQSTRWRFQGDEDGPIQVTGTVEEMAGDPEPGEQLGGGLPPVGDEVDLPVEVVEPKKAARPAARGGK